MCEWLIGSMCGIKIGEKPNTFVIKPMVGGTLTHAKASYNSVYGLVESGWEKQNGKTVYTVKIPCNCAAEIILPNGTQTVDAGQHKF